jgi:hypothetical protein
MIIRKGPMFALLSTQTVLRDWSLAKAWLRREMTQAGV